MPLQNHQQWRQDNNSISTKINFNLFTYKEKTIWVYVFDSNIVLVNMFAIDYLIELIVSI